MNTHTHGYKSTGFKSSKEMAQRLRNLAEFLENHEDFQLENGAYLSGYNGSFALSFDTKQKFIDAVKVIGDAEKYYTEGDYAKLVVSSKFSPIELTISRDKVCKKTVVYDCEPLFSDAEVEAL